ncbi:MAG: hypothetical protein R3B65_00230 [Candidatus Paceibacterota bacterium]
MLYDKKELNSFDNEQLERQARMLAYDRGCCVYWSCDFGHDTDPGEGSAVGLPLLEKALNEAPFSFKLD